MADTDYIKDPPQTVLDLMKDTFGSYFNEYYLGSPTAIPEAAYPCCVVQVEQSSNSIQGAPTGHDLVSELITVNFLENSKDDAGTPGNNDTTIRRMYQYVQGRDPATGWYRSNTALHALRTNLDLTTGATGYRTVIDHDVDTNYNVVPRPDKPAIVVAEITIVTRERIPVNRQQQN